MSIKHSLAKFIITPLPTWHQLLTSFVGKSPNDDQLARPWLTNNNDIAYILSRGAWSLRVLAEWMVKLHENEIPRLWFPDYFCNEPLNYLRDLPIEIKYYPVDKDFSPNWELCEKMAFNSAPHLFVLVHYFGFCNQISNTRKFCKKHRALFVEDAAHVLIPNSGIGHSSDVVCYSPHKLLAIPEGAVMVVRTNGDGIRSQGKEYILNLLEQLINGYKGFTPAPWKWIIKRAIQKIFPVSVISHNEEVVTELSAKSFPFLGRVSKNLMVNAIGNLKDIQEKRHENNALLDGLVLNTMAKAGYVPLKVRERSTSLPYLASYYREDGEHADVFVKKLATKGVLVQTWPDLPDVVVQRDEYAVAKTHRAAVITLPVHQSLTVRMIEKIAESIGDATDNNIKSYTEIIWGISTKRWDEILSQINKSNLLQSLSYGEAKVNEGWSIKRGLIKLNGTEVGLIQALERKIGPFTVTRINRNPLFLNGTPSHTESLNIYRRVRQEWRFSRGCFLFMAPELPLKGGFEGILKLAKFRRYTKRKWHSSWIDLKKTDDTLRKSLKGKWRNQLKSAEKSGLQLDADQCDEHFKWIIERYDNMKSKKEFIGLSSSLLHTLWDSNPNPLVVLSAIDVSGNRVASVILFVHGLSATYLIGWNGDEGRKLNAGNFLLWNGMLLMKQKEIVSFDVGGMSPEDMVDIARFKRGMGGEDYILLGEYINI